MKFHKVESSPNFFQIEEQISQYWKDNNTFEKSITTKSEDKPYRFYDGPPFITGLPHYGGLLSSIVKDVVTRFWTQKGHRIDRVWGWDCHGIYVEQKVQAKLGLNSNLEIEKLGIDKFIEACYEYTSEISDQWEWYVDHLGRWVDFKNAYKTMDNDYMESVMRVFKTLYDKNMVYKGKRVSLYSTKLNTPISNYEIALDNSYADISDPAITVKFRVNGYTSHPKTQQYKDQYIHSNDGCATAAFGIIKNPEGGILMLYDLKKGVWTLPGGKIDLGEEIDAGVVREVKEELGVGTKISKELGTVKFCHVNLCAKWCFYELNLDGVPSIQEKDTHGDLRYVKIQTSENELGFEINIDGTIMSDVEEIKDKFRVLYWYGLGLFGKDAQPSTFNLQPSTPIYFLAWTTTPWTIPANLALVVNADIDYSQIYDITTQEYYILAHNLISKYYKDPSQYILIYTCKGSELVGLSYQPPFSYLNPLGSAASPLSGGTGGQNDFKVYAADYVLDTDGTGIVHTAPEFGEDDFQTGKKFGLTQTEVLDLEGKYNPIISDMAGVYYRDANDIVIDKLKASGLLLKKEQIVHSVAMCPRTNVPLIYKTQDSWFINIQSIKGKLAEHNQDINWVPGHLKDGRFAKSMESAPDWCISRTRYWATPMPVWAPESDVQNSMIDPSTIQVFGSREEIFQLDQLGSKKLKKIIAVRHGESVKNIENWHDSLGSAGLTERGKKDANKLAERILDKGALIVVSPLSRSFETILPYLQKHYDQQIVQQITTSYQEVVQKYQQIFKEGDIIDYINNEQGQLVFPIHDNVVVDFRVVEQLLLKYQQQNVDHIMAITEQWSDDATYGETQKQVYQRVYKSINEIIKTSNHATIIIATHADPVLATTMIFKGTSYDKEHQNYPKRGKERTFYIDTDTNKEFDLHRPFIDKIWGMVNGVKYVRIPEVLDPRLESGSMPYAQVHYPFENKAKFENSFPADYVAEYLGQVRCWFFFMHALGVMLFDSPAFTNVICTGVLAGNDGRKMSKSLGNYPDPKEAMTAYGSDALRMYMANSPIVVGGDMNFMEEGWKEVLRKISLPMWNSYSFFCTYASIDEFEPNCHSLSDMLNYPLDNKLDQWLIARLTQLVSQVHDGFVAYDMVAASTPIYEFMDDLTNWYIRRSRRRFWKSENDGDKLQAYNTLYVTLVELCKVLAPFMPFISEHIYRDLTGRESVHLDEWTEVE